MISSILVSYPNSTFGSYATISIRPNSYIVITEIENSDLTVSDFLSAVGGIYATAMGIYLFLYGSYEMNPWGLIQNLPRVRHKVRTTLYESLRPNIPFSGPVLSKDLSSDEKFEAVQQRLLLLEFFLKEYVVGVDNIMSDEIAAK
ncbi:3570_t:CDS:2, partial [Paraglomus brasilianum]